MDIPLRLEYGVTYRLIVTSADVVHPFSMPTLNLKMDAVSECLNYLFIVRLTTVPLKHIVQNCVESTMNQ